MTSGTPMLAGNVFAIGWKVAAVLAGVIFSIGQVALLRGVDEVRQLRLAIIDVDKRLIAREQNEYTIQDALSDAREHREEHVRLFQSVIADARTHWTEHVRLQETITTLERRLEDCERAEQE